MSEVGRVSNIPDTPAIQYLNYRLNAFEEAQYGDEAGGATQARPDDKVKGGEVTHA